MFTESYEPVRNGVAVSVATLRDELRLLGHEVYCVAPGYPGHHEMDSHVFRFPYIRTWRAPDYPLAIPYLPGFQRTIRELGLDIIHTHTPFMLGCLGLRLGKQFGIPVISTNHTQYVEYAHYFPAVPNRWVRAFLVRHMRKYYNSCNAVTVPTKPIVRILHEYGIRTPIHVMPAGSSLDTSRNLQARLEIRQQYSIPKESQVIMYVGRLAREKNLDLLLRAFDILARKHSNVYLMLIGSGPDEQRYRNSATSLKAPGKVIFTGSMPREIVARYYSAGDIFALPSTTETQGLVVCEALGAGLPAVVVRAGGAQEMIVPGEDGFLAENTVEDFAMKIDSLLGNSELLAKMSAQAVCNATRFCPRNMARRFVELYKTVISGTKTESSTCFCETVTHPQC